MSSRVGRVTVRPGTSPSNSRASSATSRVGVVVCTVSRPLPPGAPQLTRAAAAARVSWDAAGDTRRTTVQTTTPTRLVAELAREFDGEVPGLTVTRPTLEDVYLDLISEAKP